jgi:hypothetical protein
MGEPTFEAAWAAGRALSRDRAIASALAITLSTAALDETVAEPLDGPAVERAD